MHLQLKYDSIEPLEEQLRARGYTFMDNDARSIAQKAVFYLDFLYVQGFISTGDKYKSMIHLDRFVKSHIIPLKKGSNNERAQSF